MQPYFFPYIGYFQLMDAVDKFIVYDNIQYSKKGWINKNKFLLNGKEKFFTIPIKKDSDFLDVCDRYRSENSIQEAQKILRQIHSSYRKSPNFKSVFTLIEDCFMNEENNLFNYIFYSLKKIKLFLDIKTDIVVSSNLKINHDLKSQDKVIQICSVLDADQYLNSIGGLKLYDKDIFQKNRIKLSFLQSNDIKYNQFNADFISWLSIIDILMFNSTKQIKLFLKEYTKL